MPVINAWGIGFSLKYNKDFSDQAKYFIFRGYAPGFGNPEFRWNMSASKTIKSVTLSLKMNDILNQERSLSRVVSSGYMEDSLKITRRTL